MGIILKIKSWWVSRTTTEKICVILGAISTAASVSTAILASETLSNIKVDVKLYPNGKDDPMPLQLIPEGEEPDYTKPVPSPYDNGRYDPYELSRDLFNLLESQLNSENQDSKEFEEARRKSLQLAWDLAAREGKIEKAEDEIPYQLYD